MDMDDILKETLTELLDKIGVEYNKIEIDEDENGGYLVNVKSENPSLLIGYHGENIQALQHLLKVLSWKKSGTENTYNILLDVDDYRKRQEDNVLALTERKISMLRSSGRPQTLPPMSPYFRRKVHMYCMGAGYEDIETESKGENDQRHIILKLK